LTEIANQIWCKSDKTEGTVLHTQKWGYLYPKPPVNDANIWGIHIRMPRYVQNE